MLDDKNDKGKESPADPASRLSSKAHLAYYLTGGTGRGPSSMTSFLKMAWDRADAGRGSKAWDAARKEDREREASVSGPKPKGRALVRWYRENRRGLEDGKKVTSADQPAQPMEQQQQQQQQQQGQQGQQPGIDVHMVSDEERQRHQETNEASNGQNEAGDDAEPRQQPSGDLGDGHQRQSPDTPTEHQGGN